MDLRCNVDVRECEENEGAKDWGDGVLKSWDPGGYGRRWVLDGKSGGGLGAVVGFAGGRWCWFGRESYSVGS